MQPLDLALNYLHLRGESDVDRHQATPGFWEDLPNRADLHEGRLVVPSRFDGDWPKWEVHHQGEELVVLLEGEFDLLLEGNGVQERVPLRRAGDTAIVPRGVWHTADVPIRASALFVTPGAWETEHRPR